MTARIIEPTSKQDAARVLAEAGVRALSNRTMKRRPRGMPSRSGGTGCRGRARPAARSDPPPWCSVTSRPCGSRPKPGDSFREPAFSKERRLEPQITGGGCSPTRPGCR